MKFTFDKINEQYKLYTYSPKESLKYGVHKFKFSLSKENKTHFDEEEFCHQYNYDSSIDIKFEIKKYPTDPFIGKNKKALQKNEQLFLKTLNNLRLKLKLGAVKINLILTKAAQAHENYLSKYGYGEGHKESVNKKGFTGVGPQNRAENFGISQEALIGEVITPISEGKEALYSLIDAPYHRFPLIDYSLKEMGSGSSNYHVIDLGFYNTFEENPDLILPKQDLTVYPYNNQKGILTTWTGGEIPDPLRLLKNEESYTIGYPITVSGHGNFHEYKSISIMSKGKKVSYYRFDYKFDDFLSSKELMIFPKAPMKYNQKYTVTVEYQIIDDNDQVKTKKYSWSFYTEKE